MLSALILFLVIGLLPFFVRELRNGGRIILAYWFVIALHQVVAFMNNFYFEVVGIPGDAESFHYRGVLRALSGNIVYSPGHLFYESMLGVIYRLFGPSKLLGEQFSILAFAISCIVLIKILRLLELSSYRASVLLVFGSLPSMVIFSSVTLRESYEILFFMFAVYFGIKMYVERGVSKYYVFMIVSVLLMGLFHYALMVYAVFLVVLFMVWTPFPSSGWQIIKKRKLVIVFAMLVSLAGIILASKSGLINLNSLPELPKIGVLGIVSNWRGKIPYLVGVAGARASYLIPVDFSSPIETIRTFFLIYTHYVFGPFPWRIRNIADVVLFVESVFRMVLIYYSVKHWLKAHGLQRRLLGLMLLLFFSMSFMWSLGTTNYGTAARHNLLAWWILSIAGTPMLMRVLGRFRLG